MIRTNFVLEIVDQPQTIHKERYKREIPQFNNALPQSCQHFLPSERKSPFKYPTIKVGCIYIQMYKFYFRLVFLRNGSFVFSTRYHQTMGEILIKCTFLFN